MKKRKGTNRIDEAIAILTAIDIPMSDLSDLRRSRMALALLAVADLRPTDPWSAAKAWHGEGSFSVTTRRIIAFWNSHYGLEVSPGSYDDVRRRDLERLVLAGVVLPAANHVEAATNDPTRGYAVSREAGPLLTRFGEADWDARVTEFRNLAGSLADRFERRRNVARVPVALPDGATLNLGPGAHNRLQKLVVEAFVPRWIKRPKLLYIGDTRRKTLYVDEVSLTGVRMPSPAHELLPDVVVLDRERRWLFLIEAVHSSNPVSAARHLKLEQLSAACAVPRVYVSAFLDRPSFRRWVCEISWETEVWLADAPDHLVHFNGDRFLGPHPPR